MGDTVRLLNISHKIEKHKSQGFCLLWSTFQYQSYADEFKFCHHNFFMFSHLIPTL